MQVSSSSLNSWFIALSSNRYRHVPCSSTTTLVAATLYSPRYKNRNNNDNNNCLSFLVSQRKGFTLTSLAPIRNTRKRRGFTVSAVFEKFTERAIKAIMFSQKEAKALGSDLVYTQHLLLGLIAEEDRSLDGFLASGVTIDKARDVVRSVWHQNDSARADGYEYDQSSSVSATHVPFSISSKRVFEAAVEYSKSLGHKFIAPEHIAVALVKVDDGSANRVLYRLGANANQLAAVAFARLQKELAKDGREPNMVSNGVHNKSVSRKGSDAGSSATTNEMNALSQFCVDLTARASEGLIDPVIGREVEVQRIVQILCRKTKSNPILLGESGVGKTAIAEGLAIRIAQADIAPFLLTKRVLSLDVAMLMAGAKERGELEERVTKLIKDIIESGDVILFIDEVHTLVQSGTTGRGSKGSGLDIANLLKPALGRGQFQVH